MCNDVLLIGRTGNQSNSPHFKFILVRRSVFTLYRNVLLMIDIYVCVCVIEGVLCNLLQSEVQAGVHGQEGGSRLCHLSFYSDKR